MSMDGRRFGVALALGVLLAMVVVAASGALGPSMSFEHAPASSTAATSTAATVTYTTVSSAPVGGSTGGANGSQSPGTTTDFSPTYQPVAGGFSSILNLMPSPRFAALGSQSPGSNALLIVPLVVALVLGGALYRMSSKGKGPQKEE